MEHNVAIEQNIKKRVRIFLKPNGEKIKGGAEAYFGNNMGSNMGRAGQPDFPSQGGKGA